jgi:hypothetical protein
MLDHAQPERPVTVVWGEGGIGKSTLLDYMEQECEARGVSRAKVLWTETRNQDFLGVMRKLRDDLGAERFSHFNALVNFFTSPPTAAAKVELVVGSASVSVAENLRNHGTIGSVVGAEILVKDLNIALPSIDHGISPSERMARLTDMFLRDLSAAAASGPIILFLDAFEKASEITRNWVCNKLVGALLDGRMMNVRVVISGRIRPSWPDDWWLVANEMQLTPFEAKHVIQYLEKNHLSFHEAARDDIVDVLLSTGNSVPGRLAATVQSWSENESVRQHD